MSHCSVTAKFSIVCIFWAIFCVPIVPGRGPFKNQDDIIRWVCQVIIREELENAFPAENACECCKL